MERKNFYFVANLNGETKEIIRVLTEQNAEFEVVEPKKIPHCLKPLFMASEDAVHTYVHAGYHIVFIFVERPLMPAEQDTYRRSFYGGGHNSALSLVLADFNLEPNDWQKKIMIWYKDTQETPWDKIFRLVVKNGYTREEIEMLTEYCLMAEELTEDVERVRFTDEDMFIYGTRHPANLFVFNNLPNKKNDAMLYKIVWKQRFPNILIFKDNKAFYFGFEDIKDTLRNQVPELVKRSDAKMTVLSCENNSQRKTIIKIVEEMTELKEKSGIC